MNIDYTAKMIHWFVCELGKKTDKMRVLKLFFFADRYHMRKYGVPITEGRYSARPQGPVPDDIYEVMHGIEMRSNKNSWADKHIKLYKHVLEVSGKVHPYEFKSSHYDALQFARDSFGKENSKELSELTHIYPEWKVTYKEDVPQKTKTHARKHYASIPIWMMFMDTAVSVQTYARLPPNEADKLREYHRRIQRGWNSLIPKKHALGTKAKTISEQLEDISTLKDKWFEGEYGTKYDPMKLLWLRGVFLNYYNNKDTPYIYPLENGELSCEWRRDGKLTVILTINLNTMQGEFEEYSTSKLLPKERGDITSKDFWDELNTKLQSIAEHVR